jgi:hypothetical protein
MHGREPASTICARKNRIRPKDWQQAFKDGNARSPELTHATQKPPLGTLPIGTLHPRGSMRSPGFIANPAREQSRSIFLTDSQTKS